MKKIKKALKKFFSEMDLFSVNPTLRSHDQPYSATPLLGLLSLIIFGLFIAVFTNKLVMIKKMDSYEIKVTNTFSTSVQNKTINNLMFGVSIRKPNQGEYIKTIADFEKYFIMRAKVQDSQILLKPCSVNLWKQLGDDYIKIYESNVLSRCFCPQKLINLTTKSPEIFLSITLSACKNGSGIICQTQQNILNYFDLIAKQQSGYFPFYVNFMAPFAQVQSPNPLTYYVHAKKYSFSALQSATYFIKFDQFSITTDSFIWPNFLGEDLHQTGGLEPVQTFYAYKNYVNTSELLKNPLITVNCYASQNLNQYSRNLTKIDQVLSYIGGLFGIVTLIFLFFLGRYNQYRYELRVGEYTFNYDQKSHKYYQKNLNILIFIKYTIFYWVKLIFNHELNWPRIKQMSDTLLQARNQLNTEKLFRRLQYLQSVIIEERSVRSIDKLRVMSLIEHKSLQQIQNKRLILQYYQQIIGLQISITVKDLVQRPQQFKEYFQIIYKQKQQGLLSEKEKEEYFNSQQEIYQTLMIDLDLHTQPTICQKIANHPIIAQKAGKHDLAGFQKVQQNFAKAFLHIPQKYKKRALQKLPIKILHRLRKVAAILNKNNPQRNRFVPKMERLKTIQDIIRQLSLFQNQQKNKIQKQIK